METLTSQRQEAGGRGLVIRKVTSGGQIAQMAGWALPPPAV